MKIEPVNDALLNSGIRHALHIEGLKEGEASRVVKLLSKSQKDLVSKLENRLSVIKKVGFDPNPAKTKRFQVMIDEANGLIGGGMRNASASVQKRLEEAAISEAQYQAATLAKLMPFEKTFSMPSIATLKAITTSKPFEGKLLKDWFGDLAKSTQSNLARELNLGLIQGQSVPDLAKRVREVLKTTRRHATGLVRTATNHVMTQAREETYVENDDVVKAVQIVATLDVRTTDICISLDGQVYSIYEGPRPPFHHLCRTTTIPVTKSWKELGMKGKDTSPTTRASMNGQVSAKTTYPTWLKKQSVAFQDRVLGKTRAQLWRAGKFDISKPIFRPLKSADFEQYLGEAIVSSDIKERIAVARALLASTDDAERGVLAERLKQYGVRSKTRKQLLEGNISGLHSLERGKGMYIEKPLKTISPPKPIPIPKAQKLGNLPAITHERVTVAEKLLQTKDAALAERLKGLGIQKSVREKLLAGDVKALDVVKKGEGIRPNWVKPSIPSATHEPISYVSPAGYSKTKWVQTKNWKQAAEQLKALGVEELKGDAKYLRQVNALGEDLARVRRDFPRIGAALDKRPLKLHLYDGAIPSQSNQVAGMSWRFDRRIALNMKSSMCQSLKYNRLKIGGKFTFTCDDSLMGTFRHELGHHLQDTLDAKIVMDPGTNWSLKVSRYAGSDGNPRELFAEAFSAFTHPRYKGGLGKQLEEAIVSGKLKTRVTKGVEAKKIEVLTAKPVKKMEYRDWRKFIRDNTENLDMIWKWQDGKKFDSATLRRFNALLDKVSSYQGTSYRGLSIPESTFIRALKKEGTVLRFKKLSSSSKLKGVAEDFVSWSQKKGKRPIVLEIEGKTGVDIHKLHISHLHEREVVLRKGSWYEVKTVKKGTLYTKVTLREVQEVKGMKPVEFVKALPSTIEDRVHVAQQVLATTGEEREVLIKRLKEWGVRKKNISWLRAGGEKAEHAMTLLKKGKGIYTDIEIVGAPKGQFPSSYEQLWKNKVATKDLGGSTGAKAIIDENEVKWVIKKGSVRGQLGDEFTAEKLYRAVGTDIPESKMYAGKHKISEFIEGKQLSELAGAARQAAFEKLKKNFVVDAWTANWDVAGLDLDNIIVDKTGKVFRIDLGGALRYRAQGAPKGSAFGTTVGEIESLRDATINPSAAKVFGSLTDADIRKQVEAKLPAMRQALKTVDMPATLKAKLSARLDDIEAKWATSLKSPIAPPKMTYTPTPVGDNGIMPALGGSSAIAERVELAEKVLVSVGAEKEALIAKLKSMGVRAPVIKKLRAGDRKMIARLRKGLGVYKNKGVGTTNKLEILIPPELKNSHIEYSGWKQWVRSNSEANVQIRNWQNSSISFRQAETGVLKDSLAQKNAQVFNDALDRAPSYVGTTHRGFAVEDPTYLAAIQKKGSVIKLNCSSSSSKVYNRAKNFAHSSALVKGRKPVIFTMEGKTGVDIQSLGIKYQSEFEVVMRKDTFYEVTSSKIREGYINVRMREIKKPKTLSAVPPPKDWK